MTFTQKEIDILKDQVPVLQDIIELKPTLWLNPHLITSDLPKPFTLEINDVKDAELLWGRFAPYLVEVFPELHETKGMIESPFKRLDRLQMKLQKIFDIKFDNFYLKCDHHLPIAGSIKARGGFYEVLHYAEKLALDAKLIEPGDDYNVFSTKKFKDFFNQYSIGVGSTGNLGLSIGIISAKFGFRVSAYMSADAKEWKKNLLREIGVNVHEYDGDFSEAITKGRQITLKEPHGYFVDDEDSIDLFLGYSTAALRLQKQLEENNIKVNDENPLFLYLPCGVGGSPGGITFGMKSIFGRNVHCFFVEPTHSPAVLLGLSTGKMEQISVHDIGLNNRTEADGLAVGRPSSFATKYSHYLVSGIYTIEDQSLFKLLALLADDENIYVEPSATAGLLGPIKVMQSNYYKKHNIDPARVTHIVWSTGGDLVPEEEKKKFYKQGKKFLANEKFSGY